MNENLISFIEHCNRYRSTLPNLSQYFVLINSCTSELVSGQQFKVICHFASRGGSIFSASKRLGDDFIIHGRRDEPSNEVMALLAERRMCLVNIKEIHLGILMLMIDCAWKERRESRIYHGWIPALSLSQLSLLNTVRRESLTCHLVRGN